MVQGAIKKDKILELTNFEIPAECYTLEAKIGKLTIYKGNKKIPGSTSLYFRDNTTFFAIYPTRNGPIIFFEGKKYKVGKNLTVTLSKQGKNRKFKIVEYNIVIDYVESLYIGFDSWSDEIDVDLFYMVEQSYKEDSFYNKFTLNLSCFSEHCYKLRVGLTVKQVYLSLSLNPMEQFPNNYLNQGA